VRTPDAVPAGRRFHAQRRAEWWAGLPVLRSPCVTLRELQPADAASLPATLGTHDVQRYLSPGPVTPDDFRAFIDWTVQARTAGRYICFGVVPRGHELAAGVFQLWPVEPGFRTAEWGFALGRLFWGTGLFDESARLVLDFAFGTIGVRRLEGRSAVENGRGNGALRKLGAVPEGVLRQCFLCDGAYRDHVMWALIEEDWHRLKQTSGLQRQATMANQETSR
jgi:ribosomal-protein-alanine N-acetyltransferase